MAYTKYAWWEDRHFLQKLEMESNYDILSNKVMFRKSYSTATMRNWALFVADRDALELGEVTPDFLERYFEDVRRHAPDFRHDGPTNRELENPAVKLAWNEFQLIRRLATIGSEYELKSR